MNKTAFTLIELLVYTVLFSFFSLVAFGFCNVVYSFLSLSCSQSSRATKTALALDMIRKDLMSACPDQALWDQQKCIFCLERLDTFGNAMTTSVGWEVITNNKKGELRRSEGVYSFSEKRWVKRSTSNFGSGITALQVKLTPPSNESRITRVLVTHQSDGSECDEIIVLRNRVVL